MNVFLCNLVPGLLCWNQVINSITIDELSNAQHSADGHLYLITRLRLGANVPFTELRDGSVRAVTYLTAASTLISS